MWTYKNQTDFEIPKGAFGFVYLISKLNPNPCEQSKYIGRKYLSKTVSKRKKLKDGTKAKRLTKTRSESDWRGYMGSCKPLLEEISKLGKDKFKFEILGFGNTRGQVNFMECWMQMRYNVIANDNYYNDAIGSGQFRGVKFTDEFKQILKELE